MYSVRLVLLMQNGADKVGKWYADRGEGERGVTITEYAALLVLVGALVTALYAAGLLSKFSSAVSSAISAIFTPSSGSTTS
ncbi:hypothetical protein ACQEU6_03035 [Spirillospora sp. CA-108201]